MANSRLFQFRYSYQRDIVDIFSRISFAAAGVPTMISGKGLLSVTRISAGHYRLALKDNFFRLEMLKHVFLDSSAPASPSMYILVDNSASQTNPVIDIVFNVAGTATDPASGDIVMLQISLCTASDS